MIPPSDLYRVPPYIAPSVSEELLRYARTEHASTNLAWALSAMPARTPWGNGVRAWLASRLRLPRSAASGAPSASLRPGLAAVHFDEEGLNGRAREHPHADLDHPCEVLATSALILTVQPNQPVSDEACTCEH